MAEIYAVQNGNWSDGSTWSSGNVPTSADIVYLNNHVIQVGNQGICTFSELHNGICPSTGISGGYCYSNNAQTVTMVGDIYADSETILTCPISAIYVNYSIVGNIHNNVAPTGIYHNGATGNGTTTGIFTIVGNLYGINVVTSHWNPYITLNGEMIKNDPFSPSILFTGAHGTNSGTLNITTTTMRDLCVTHTQQLSTFNFTGDWVETDNKCLQVTSNTIVNLQINGNVESHISHKYIGTNLKFNGTIEYTSIGIFPLFYYQNFTVENPETFICKDITNPRVNPFVIITNAELNNRQQYPQESDVKKDVEYAYGQKIGTFDVDFPQESTVLKGVEYDDGNKIGTLEVIALSGATATAENISVVNLTEQEVNRVKNCATVSTVQKCFEDFKE